MSARVSVSVMAHPKRKRFVAELLAKLDRDATVVWDERNDRWHTGRRSMLAFHRDASHHLVVQDDAVIPRDLVAGIEQALTTVPVKTPLCLYCGRNRPYRDLVQQLVDNATSVTSWLTMGQLHWGVGIVMPTEHIEAMVQWCDERSDIANYDRRISRWLGHQKINTWYPWPSLVDHRDSPSLVPGRGSAGRRAHQFVGANASALDCRWDGGVISIPALSAHDVPPAPGQVGGPPVKFVSLKYPEYHIPTIGVRFRRVERPDGSVVGEAEATTRGAIAYLQSPWMRRRGIRLASELKEPQPVQVTEPAPAPETAREPETATKVDPASADARTTEPTDPTAGPGEHDTEQTEQEQPTGGDRGTAEPPPTSGPGSGAASWRAYAAEVTDTTPESWESMSRVDVQAKLRADGLLPDEDG